MRMTELLIVSALIGLLMTQNIQNHFLIKKAQSINERGAEIVNLIGSRYDFNYNDIYYDYSKPWQNHKVCRG